MPPKGTALQGLERIIGRYAIDLATGCWNWNHYRNEWGYGVLGGLIDGVEKTVLAHRFMWEQTNGLVPNDRFVLHHCDNPACINLEHLYLGTIHDNVQDMMRRGRGVQRKGERHWNAKLTAAQVQSIRDMGPEITTASLARVYGVTETAIRQVRKGKTWKSADGAKIGTLESK